VLFSYIPCAGTFEKYGTNYDRTKLKKFLNLPNRSTCRRIIFYLYINSINNIYRIYAHELRHNSYFAIRIHRFPFHANEGLIMSVIVLVTFFSYSYRADYLNGFTWKAVVVWSGKNSIVQDQLLQDVWKMNNWFINGALYVYFCHKTEILWSTLRHKKLLKKQDFYSSFVRNSRLCAKPNQQSLPQG